MSVREIYDRLLAAKDEMLRAPPEARFRYIYFAIDPSKAPVELKTKKAKAEEACRELAKGTAFAEVARRYSDDPSAAKGGGTKMALALAPVSATAVATESKTGIPSTS